MDGDDGNTWSSRSSHLYSRVFVTGTKKEIKFVSTVPSRFRINLMNSHTLSH